MSALPEQGQLVKIRGQRYTVTAVQSATLPTNIVHLKRLLSHHLVSFASIEDDATEEELEVIWEGEPGARIFEERELPYL